MSSAVRASRTFGSALQVDGGGGHSVPDEPWHEIPSPGENLMVRMREMYWAGVKHEMALILLTLREWQRPKYASIILQDENDSDIHGYDTFVDQVNEDSREFAERYGMFLVLLRLVRAPSTLYKAGSFDPIENASNHLGVPQLSRGRRGATVKF
ncbi:MAG: hypothetical protein M1839_005486 [Geoglossum umbratile]|nr:MAG: hypothetical protein M1839_005486 [Geoglossum umbratile]